MRGIRLEQINDHVVKPIKLPQQDTRPVKGFDICEECYANIFICASKKRGKTNVVFDIIKSCVSKDTKVVIFASTIYKDANWIEIRKYLDNKGIEHDDYMSIQEDGYDHLEELADDLKEKAKEEDEARRDEEEEEEKEPDMLDILAQLNGVKKYMNDEVEIPKKKRKSKYLAPEYFIVLDDISTELKSKSLIHLLKENRHYKSKIVISSQYLHDLRPESLTMIDIWLLFKGIMDPKLEIVHRLADVHVPMEDFINIYKNATKKRYTFLYIDKSNCEFRKNFHIKITPVYSDDEEE